MASRRHRPLRAAAPGTWITRRSRAATTTCSTPGCGSEREGTSRFCPSCGARLAMVRAELSSESGGGRRRAAWERRGTRGLGGGGRR